jgi:formamidopyrimidine-DNA glycosylase
VPELPEVETVRAGLARWVTDRTITTVEVRHPRAVRRHVGGAADLSARLAGATILGAARRGKYIWLPLSTGECVVVHLGMSGQLLVRPADAPDERHLHVRISFADAGPQLRFVDQRTFGGVLVDELVPTVDRPDEHIPSLIAHIARDPIDPHFDDVEFSRRLRRRDTEVKRALLDQSLISGVGNIYADESLWRAKVHGARIAETLSKSTLASILDHAAAVMTDALGVGGTSFDSLYVNVNGESGYFDRSLDAYGREGLPCHRCGAVMRRDKFMTRSSYYCPKCQPRPRR